MAMGDISSYIALTKEKRRLQSELKDTEELLRQTLEDALSTFEELGVDSMKLDGMSISPQSTLWARMGDSVDDAIETLKKYDMADLPKLTVNSMSLSARLREMEREEGIPEEFLNENAFVLNYKNTLAVRKG